MGKLKSIQCLRAIAALLVLMCHLVAIEQAAADRSSLLTSFWKNGAHGVDLFFVISGFVIVWVAADEGIGRRSATRFAYARVARIYPLWWLCAGAIAMVYWLAHDVPWDAARLAQYGMEGPDHLLRSMLLLPQAHHPVLGVGWTLVHEMYFYLVFSLLILCLPANHRLLALGVWAGLVIVGLPLGFSANFADSFVHLALYPMTLQFILGAGVAYLIKAGHNQLARTSVLLGVLGFIAAYFEWDRTLLQMVQCEGCLPTVWRRTVVYGIPSALLVYGSVALEQRTNLRGPAINAFAKLGDWSYALYLSHSLIFATLGKIIYRDVGIPQIWATSAYFVIGLISAIVASAILYYCFERPSIAYLRRYRPRASVKPNGLQAHPG